jgi:hypothetical protein
VFRKDVEEERRKDDEKVSHPYLGCNGFLVDHHGHLPEISRREGEFG